jgi:ubiquinone biosynthesis protein UbiJ
MDVLQTTLTPLLNMMNRQIGATTPARELCDKLDGRVLAVRVSNTALVAFLRVDEQQVYLSSDFSGEPDVVIGGSILSLAKLAGGSEASFRDGSVELSGDSETAEQFRQLLAYAKPDLEEELSSVVGDVAAHSMGQFARTLGQWGRAAGDTMRQNVSEYLQEESRAVPTRYELEKFSEKVNALRDDVARFEKRLQGLEDPANGAGAS